MRELNILESFQPDPERFDLKWLDEEVVDGFRLRSFRFNSTSTAAGPVITYGKVGCPDASSEQLPAILHIHGGGQTCGVENILYHLRRGYVCISFDWTGPLEGRDVNKTTSYPANVEIPIDQTDYDRIFKGGIENNRLVLLNLGLTSHRNTLRYFMSTVATTFSEELTWHPR